MRVDIAEEFFRKNVKIKKNIIQFLYTVQWCLGQNSLAHVIKRKSQYAVKRHCWPWLIQKFAQGGFSTCWIQAGSQICSLTTPAIQALRIKLFTVTTNCLWTHYYPDSDTEHIGLHNETVIGFADKENNISSLYCHFS